MAGVDVSTIAAVLKRLYDQKRIQNLVYADHPLLALMPKKGGFTGASRTIVTRYGDSQGRAHTFTNAQTQLDNFKAVNFLLTRVRDYAVYRLDSESIMATRDDKGAFVRALDAEVSSALNNLGASLAMQLYGDGTHAIGQVTVSGTTFTLQKPENIVHIEKGQKIVSSDGSTKTAALKNSGTGATVATVDRDAGSFTVSANTDTTATNDWVFIKGDRAAGAITAADYLAMAGLEAWNPASAPSSTTFYNVDRSVDVTRLGGLRIDISSYNPEEGLVVAMSKLAREGGKPDHLFLNYTDVRNVHLALGAKAVTEYMQVGDIGFSSIRLTGPKGDVKVIADQDCDVSVGRLLTLDTWALHHLGDMINVLDMDGSRLSRVSDADQFEGRAVFFGNVGCDAPGFNARLVMPS